MEFNPESLDKMSLPELTAQISRRLPSTIQAVSNTAIWVGWSLRLAWQIGCLVLAAKKQLQHGQFGEWCQEKFPLLADRTLQRYMKVAKTTALSDFTDGTSLKDVYVKAGMLIEKDRAKRNDRPPDLTTQHGPMLPDFLARLRSFREFIKVCVDETPFENLESSVIAEYATEIAALSALCEQMKSNFAKAIEAKPVSGMEIPANDVNGVSGAVATPA